MADTDIYKNREALPQGNKPQKKNRRRRRSESARAFDDKDRKRRSKNTGFRRLLHLSRKEENDKVIWTTMGIIAVAALIFIAIWQFIIVEVQVREVEKSDDYMQEDVRIPEAYKKKSKPSGAEPILP